MEDYNSLTETERLAMENAEAFKEAIAFLGQLPTFSNKLCSTDHVFLVGNALTQGIFDSTLTTRLAELYKPIEGFQRMIDELHIKPEVYTKSVDTFLPLTERLKMVETSSVITNITSGLLSFAHTVDTVGRVDWLHQDNTWTFDKTEFTHVKIPEAFPGGFLQLLRLEQNTSLINSPVLEKITSATSQIGSIQEALGANAQTTSLLADYVTFARNQHIAIQKADNENEIVWRLGALDVASKFLDRQIKWSEAITKTLPVGSDDLDEMGLSPSPISQIGCHIAYSRRDNVDQTPEEALEKSVIIAITEKGKKISENIITLNELNEDNGKECVIKYTSKTARALIEMSTTVCSTTEMMGEIVDVLYFTFYENLERIKAFIGDDDIKTGDRLVRTEDIYQCIFNIKDIRSDFRHDLCHGSDKEIKKKSERTAKCYRRYCKHRPLKAKDYKALQQGLYDDILLLEEVLIQKAIQDYADLI